MIKMEAIIDMPFGVGIRAKGETFEATESEAKILEALKRARRVGAETDSGEAASKERPGTSKKPAKTAAPQKGEYSRRDMKAD